MKTLYRGIVSAFVLAAIAGLAWFAGYKYQFGKTEKFETKEAILQQINKVSKWVTAEGYFSEVYDYKDYWMYDLSPLRKKALIRVKAKVSMGYDLSKASYDISELEKSIRVYNLPAPEIISIDHDADYYDLTEGSFNSFTIDELNSLNAKAKEYIEQVAMESELVDAVDDQAKTTFQWLRALVETAGWSLTIEESEEIPQTN